MNNLFMRTCVLAANCLWLVACFPGWALFLLATRRVKSVQTALLRRILKQNSNTEFGRLHHFDFLRTPEDYLSVPLADYEDYATAVEAIRSGHSNVLTAEPVELLQPTSGSTTASKRIPYTRSLQCEFKAAIAPWIASLYLALPSLLLGRHYWSISPNTDPVSRPEDTHSRVRVGFADDSEYLGTIQRLLTRLLFPVPSEISQVRNPRSFEYLTLLFLCRERNLRLISVWHPSFLTLLLNALSLCFDSLLRDIESGTISEMIELTPELREKFKRRLPPDPKRAKELRRINPAVRGNIREIWPHLTLISCWTDGIVEPWRTQLAETFPHAVIQGKGLTATEGIISFPLGRYSGKVCAVRSHFLEFSDMETGHVHHAWNLGQGREYSVILTTGGGLYRYRLHDVVRVNGFYGQAPYLDLLSRDNLVSDLVGEKLNARHVADSLTQVKQSMNLHLRFALLAPVLESPEKVNPGYVLYCQPEPEDSPDFQDLARRMETELSQNYHYQHARRLSQLTPLRVFLVSGEASEFYRQHLMERGMKAGDIKFQVLSTDSAWSVVLPGKFVA